MKKYLFPFIAAFGLVISGCNKSENSTCNNGQLDDNETEIDCGGRCEPCPPAASLSATLLGYNYNASAANGYYQGSALQITSSGTGGAAITFSFVGTTLNSKLPITSGIFYTNPSNFYNFELADTGSVVLTEHDDVRKIISGRFSFSSRDGNDIETIDDGVFSNVRYY